MHRPSKRDWAVAAAATFLFAFLMTLPGLLPGRVMLPLDHPRDLAAWKSDPNTRFAISNKILSDPVYEYYAWDVEVRRLLSRGEMPWRNAWAGDGAHLFANPETVLLFPTTWPRLMFGARGWAITVLLKLWLAALGMWWLSSMLTGRTRLGIVAGIVYACSGYATVWLLFPHVNVLAMLPWLTGSALRFLGEPGRRNAAALIGTAALATAGGHPETLFHGVLAIAVFAIVFVRQRRVAMRTVWKAAAAAACGFLLVSIQLVPFATALAESDIVVARAAEPHQGVRFFAIAAQFLPGFLGSPLRGELDLSGLRQPAAENFNERTAGFTGAIALLLLVLGWKRVERQHRVAVIIGLVSLLIAWRAPILSRVIEALPLFSIAANERLAFVFAFFASATLPAFIDGAASEARRKTGIALAVLATPVVLGAIAVALPQSRPVLMSTARRGIDSLRARNYLNKPAVVYEQRLDGYITGARGTVLRRLALPAFFVALAGVALRRRRADLLSLAVAGEMLAFSWGYNPSIRESEIARFLSREWTPGLQLAGGGPPPAVGVWEIPNAAAVVRPTNQPPNGLKLGAMATLLALLLSATLLRFTADLPHPASTSSDLMRPH